MTGWAGPSATAPGPAIETEAAIAPCFEKTFPTTYRDGAPMQASSPYDSSGVLKKARRPSTTSRTSKTNPSRMDGSLTSPGVVNGSAKIL